MNRTYKYTLPKGMEVEKTNVRVENGQILVDVELKEKFEPKDGDFLTNSYDKVFIFNGKRCENLEYGAYCGVHIKGEIKLFDNNGVDRWTDRYGVRYATEEEKSAFLERLEKELHKRWNPETKQFENIRWRAKVDEGYYFINDQLEISRTNDGKYTIDEKRHQAGNYFFNPGAAQKVIVQIKDIFKNSKAE